MWLLWNFRFSVCKWVMKKTILTSSVSSETLKIGKINAQINDTKNRFKLLDWRFFLIFLLQFQSMLFKYLMCLFQMFESTIVWEWETGLYLFETQKMASRFSNTSNQFDLIPVSGQMNLSIMRKKWAVKKNSE